jgi:hypothetical protein
MSWTCQDYIENILHEIGALHSGGDQRKLMLHAAIARPDVSTRIKQYLEDHSLRTAPNPPYSMCLTLSDFFIFGYANSALSRSGL